MGRKVKLKDVAQVTTGKTPRKNNKDNYLNGHIPFVKPPHLNSNTPILETNEYVSEIGLNESTLIKKNSVLVSCIGSLGKVGIAGTDLVTNQQINSITFKPDLVDFKYGYYLAKTFKGHLEHISNNAVVPIVNKTAFSEISFELPPLEDQKRIVKILDQADALRQKRKQAIELLDEYVKSVFLEMFGDPVSNPMGWEKVEIQSVCEEIVDCVNRTAPTVDQKTLFKMIRTTNVKNKKIDISEVRYVNEKTYIKWTRRSKPKVGDIIFTREAPVGEAGIIDFDANVFLGQRTMQYRVNNKLGTPEYILFQLTGPDIKRQMDRLSSGSTVKHLSVPECKKFKICLPPLELQLKFAAFINKTDNLRQNMLHQFQELDTQFQTLMQKAFKGEL